MVPVRILLQAVVKRAGGQFFQDRLARTSLALWVGIVFENRVLKLPFEFIELEVGRLVARHRSLTLLHWLPGAQKIP